MDTINGYIESSGTYYRKGTSMGVIRALEYAKAHNIRITLDYGDTETGESWDEVYDVTGYVGRTTGEIKTPILCYNSRSLGGGLILTQNILSIRYANKKNGGYLYKQAN